MVTPMAADLRHLFEAATILLVGASEDPRKTAGKPLRLLEKYGYRGEIMIVNPVHKEIAGHRCYPKVEDVPQRPELSLVLTPATSVLGAVDAVLERGGRDIIVVSGGFSDVGQHERQQELVDLIHAAGARLLGPNCLGLANIGTGLTATFAGSLYHYTVPPGEVSLVTQSGSVGNAIVMRLLERHVGLAKWIATGNEADITVMDALEYLISDPQTRAIGCYVESVRNGSDWAALGRRAEAASKPLIVLKAGRSSVGAAAVESHSGKSAGSYEAWRQIAERSGIDIAESLEELADKVYSRRPGRTLSRSQAVPGRRTAAVGTGGFGVLVSDAAVEWGLPLAALSDATTAELGRLLPPTATLHNPVDPTPVPDAVFYQTGLVLLADPGVDVLLLTLTSLSRTYDQMPEQLSVLGERARQLGKTLIVSYFSPLDRLASEVEAELHASRGVLFFGDPVLAIRALGRRTGVGTGRDGRSDAVPARRSRGSGARVLGWREATSLLADWGLSAVPTLALHSRDEAAQYCRGTESRGTESRRGTAGIVLKLDDPAMPHKTEHSAVYVGIRDRDVAAAAFDDLAAKRSPAGQVIGQECIGGGTELVIGCWTDPELGKVVSVNAGGIFTELAGVPAIGTCPLSLAEAGELLDASLAGRLLHGYRGTRQLPADVVADVVSTLSRCFAGQPDLRELEVNPLIVRHDGAHIVDILAIAQPAEESA
jgi:acetate---CoA ligase (ADP-forming)